MRTHFPRRDRGIIKRSARLIAAALLLLPAVGGTGLADGLTGYLQWEITNVDQTVEDNTNQRTETKSESLLQRYSLTFDRRVYPNLTLYASGLAERTDITTETDGTETDSTLRRLRPVVELRLRTPLYVAEVSYIRNEQKTKTAGISPRTDVRESYFSNLQWKPDRFPLLKFQHFRTNNYDKDRLFRDTTEDQFQFTAEYRPVDPLFLWYQGTLRQGEDRLEEIDIQETLNAARVTYDDSWWDGLVTIYSDYKGDRRETEVDARAGGEITLSVPALEGFSAIDDTPEEGALAPNPALIDGNLTAGAGINLGLPPPGGDIRPRNIGLRLDDGTEVNTLFVWVDRELPPEITGDFSWQVYTSDDNREWNPAGGPSPAEFDTFQNRFEIRFPNVTDRYVKVVVDPLSPTAPGATQFPAILVTELQAAISRPAEEAVGKQVRTVHRYNLDIRMRLLRVPRVFYEFSYLLTKPDPGLSTWTLSNGLSAIHRFSPKFSGVARARREDGVERGLDRVAYIYSASLTAEPLPTLRHTLVFSGQDETLDEFNQKTHSLFLQNNAKLYQGVDLTLGGGLTKQSVETGEDTYTTSLNGLLSLVPNRKMTVNLLYGGRTSERSGGALPETETTYTRRGEVNVTITPVTTLYLFGSWAIVERSDTETRTIQRYNLTYSPFPDGTLRFNFFYSDEFESQSDRRTTVVTPFVRWNITAKMYLDLTYSDISDESNVLNTDTQIYNGTFRISF